MKNELLDNHLPLFAPVANENTRSKLENQFWMFHKKNPTVYSLFVQFAREARTRRAKIGAKAIWERLRWETYITRNEEFKLNNNHTAFYARLAMTNEPDLKDVFKLRRQEIQSTIGPDNSTLPCGKHVA